MSIQSEINRISDEVSTQEDLISQITAALANKTAGSSFTAYEFGTSTFANTLLSNKYLVVELDDGCLNTPESGSEEQYYDNTGGLMLAVGSGYSSVRFDFFGGGYTGKYINFCDGDSSGYYVDTNLTSVSGKFHIAYVRIENEGVMFPDYDYELEEYTTQAEVKYFVLIPVGG